MIKYKRFEGKSSGDLDIEDARKQVLYQLNKWLEVNKIDIVGMQWETYFIGNNNHKINVVRIEIMYQEQ